MLRSPTASSAGQQTSEELMENLTPDLTHPLGIEDRAIPERASRHASTKPQTGNGLRLIEV